MIKILKDSYFPETKNHDQNESTAAGAVKKVLAEKPGGLTGLESALHTLVQMPAELKSFKQQHQNFVVVGIGGSSLGVQVLAEIKHVRNFQFIDNVDAVFIEHLLQTVDAKNTGWIFISKSGRTIETLAALEFIEQHLNTQNVKLNEHCVVITEKKESDLFTWAQKPSVIFYEIPLNVGGRFSVLSAVGLIPAWLMGYDVAAMRAGALKAYGAEMQLTRLTAESLNSFARNEWITVLWSYSSRLKFFGFWWQQLWAESLAKKVNTAGAVARRASTPLPLVGATDQHSVLQQVMEGARDKMVFFLRVNEAEGGKVKLQKSQMKETALLAGRPLGDLLRAEAEAIQQALSEVGVPNLSMQVEDLSDESVGYLFMFFQLLVMAMGEALEINTFDQPGVELGKIKAKQILARV